MIEVLTVQSGTAFQVACGSRSIVVLSVLIHRAVNAFAFQNQIRSRRMSGPTPQTPANGHDLSQLAQWLFVGGVALLVAGGIAVLLLLSSRAADSLVLAILSIL